VRAKEMLSDIGVSLIIEPHLPGTYLDGAAVLMNGTTPVIALTLRYDRLDNFWFVLFHELFHILKHLKKDKLEFIFDDLDMDITTDLETEADFLAGEALISSEEWGTALARYTQSSDAVLAFSSEIGISPAIVAGRIRNESKNFTILNDLIGKGEVRIHFPESTFGI
jgi:HTH-type transcriptional regulator/antitoxin HigA